MIRRDFLKKAGIVGLSAFPELRLFAGTGISWRNIDLSWTNNVPPLICFAYIDPGIVSQQNQEALVARYPVAVIPQDNRLRGVTFREEVKKLNNAIKLLAYQMTIEETSVLGPGHDILRGISDSWVKNSDGSDHYVSIGGKNRRLFDPRSTQWQAGFVEACEATLYDYPYEGLFLDQCSVFLTHSSDQAVREDMMTALNETLDKLRLLFPSKIILGNTMYHHDVLNGETNESRPERLEKETANKSHAGPVMDIFIFREDPFNENGSRLLEMCELALKNQCFFAATSSYQKVYWPPIFQEISKLFISPPSRPLMLPPVIGS